MPRDDELASSREGLLQPEASHEHSDESESDAESIRRSTPAETTTSGLRGGGYLAEKRESLKNSIREPRQARDARYARRSRRKDGWLRSRTCCLIVTILLTGLGILLASVAWVFKTHASPDGQSPPWYPSPKGGTLESWKGSYAKASKMVGKMSLVEKVNITTGTGWATNLCVGNTGPAVNAGFPMLCLQDGPLGIRFADHATVWPAGITTGATWNKDLMYRRGRGLGREHRLKGVNVLLGPAMGPLGRMPAGGRNWEGFGPDPVLTGVAAAQTIKGVQEEGVMATAKHLIGNEQEHFRQAWEWGTPNAISSNIDDRTLHELYLWPFADGIRAGVASLMCSYNMVNNSYACGNSKLLNGILKDELDFQGFVQSDWLAQRSGVASALAGLDMSMPGDGRKWDDRDSFWGSRLTEAALNGSLPMERLNDMATRIVAAWYQLGQDDKARWPDEGPNFSSFTNDKIGRLHQGSNDETTAEVNKFVDVQGAGDQFHGNLAQEVAAEGMVLVKNEEQILPLSPSGWSDNTSPSISQKFRVGIYGEDAGPNPDGPNACPDRACNVGTLAQGWGSGTAEYPFLKIPIDSLKSTFNESSVEMTAVLSNQVSTSDLTNAKEQDLCIAFINSDAGEGYVSWKSITDRNDLFAQKDGENLIKKILDHCDRTVIVVHAVGPVVLERWIDHPNVKAVILAHLPGEASGDSLVDVLFGKVDASGRLPYTVGKSLKDYGPGGQIMYKPNGLAPQQDFKEGLLIDYRHFDAKNITPRYEFGFGLSYTSFEFSNLVLEPLQPRSPLPATRPDAVIEPPSYPTHIPNPTEALWPSNFPRLGRYVYPYRDNTTVSTAPYPYPTGYFNPQPPSPAGGGLGGNPSLFEDVLSISVDVTNIGNRVGKQVVQIYVSFPSTVDVATGKSVAFPVKVLRGFEKVEIEAGESATVKINLTRRDLSYWSSVRSNWVVPEGEIIIRAGASSRDLPLTASWT